MSEPLVHEHEWLWVSCDGITWFKLPDSDHMEARQICKHCKMHRVMRAIKCNHSHIIELVTSLD